MYKAQILLEDWQYQQLQRLSLIKKKSLSQLAREWIVEKLGRSLAGRKQDPLNEAAGMLKGSVERRVGVTDLDRHIYKFAPHSKTAD